MDIKAFPVFTYGGSLDPSEAPSFASLVTDAQLPETFIVCSSSKEATFDDVGFYTILGDDSSDWLTVIVWPLWGGVTLTVIWDREPHFAGYIPNPIVDHWYHTCLKMDLITKEIEFAVNGLLMEKAVGKNITNMPSKLQMNIGVGQDKRQYRGSVANIQIFAEGDIKEISAAPCKQRQGTLLLWNPNLWRVVGSNWLLKEEYEEIICVPYERYNLAISSKITLEESLNICKEKLKNSFIPYPENHSAFLKYVAWHQDITGGRCTKVWTPLTDLTSEGVFLNMNNNSIQQYQIWDKGQPNGGKNENFAVINLQYAAMNDANERMSFCSTCSLSSSLLLRLDGVCEDSIIGNLHPKLTSSLPK